MTGSIRTPEQKPSPGNERRLVFCICVFLAALVLAVFCRTLQYGFINFDDDLYVTANPTVTNGLSGAGVIRVFSHDMCSFYHPLTMMSLMLDAQVYGVNAAGYHATNVLLHAGAVIFLFLALRKLTGRIWPSAFVAALFAIHPLRVESVAWVAERKDVLSGLFFALALWAYAGYARTPFSPRRYVTVVLVFALGLLSKPTLVTLPFILLLLDYWPLNRWQITASRSALKTLLPLIIEKIPLFILSGVACVATVIAESKTLTPMGKLPPFLQLGNVFISYAAYLGQMFYPARLAPFYPYPIAGLSPWKIAGAIVLLAAISVAVLALWRRAPYLLVGWLWYLGMLVPMIGLFQVGAFARADRFTYLSQIGLYLMIAFAVATVATSRRWPQVFVGITALGVIAALTVCASIQASYWHDSETLWRHTLACTPANAVAHNNLGTALAAEGRDPEAIQQFQAALAIDPRSTETYFNLAVTRAAHHQTSEAIQLYQKAIELKPDYAEADNNLGILLAATGRIADAVQYFEDAVANKPDYADADNNLGIALAAQGHLKEAVEVFQKAIAINPEYADAHFNLANALALQGQTPEAIQHYQIALRLNPNLEAARQQLRALESSPAPP